MRRHPPSAPQAGLRSIAGVPFPRRGDRSLRLSWDAHLLLGTAAYIALFAFWQLFGWGGSRYQTLVGDLAPLPVHGALCVLLLRTALHTPPGSRQRRAWFLMMAAGVAFALGDAIWAL